MYDGWIWLQTERRRYSLGGFDNTVKKHWIVVGTEYDVDAEEITAMCGEVVVNGETALCVERLRRGRLS